MTDTREQRLLAAARRARAALAMVTRTDQVVTGPNIQSAWATCVAAETKLRAALKEYESDD